MAFANKILPHYTIEDWEHWKGQWELIDGFPIAMSPTPIPDHQRVAAEITAELIFSIRKAGCKKCRVYHLLDYVITNDTILVPDVLIVCGEIAKKYLDFPPALVVEILSPSTALRDRNTKFELYQQQGVLYYLLVDSNNKEVEIYRLHNGRYQKEEGADSYQFHLEDCAIAPSFSNIFH
jgi:Uma2 family endonuclease